MKIGLYNLEPKINNSAMMQVSQYHKQRNDNIYIYSPLYHDTYDKIYAFSLFDFTDKSYVTSDMICGGTGFDISSRLPKEIEDCDLDYSIFPNCDYSIIWFSRGCFRNCPFCVVREKEGYIRSVQPKNLNPNGKFIKIMDNNFFANPQWREAVKQLHEWDQPVDIQGFDIRIFDEEQGEALTTLKHDKRFKFAWDNPRENIDDKIGLLMEYLHPERVICYVLVGYWSTPQEDLMRILHLWDNFGINAFVMPYNKFDSYQRKLARWCNNKVLFKTRTWEEYLDGYTNSREEYLQKQRKKSFDKYQSSLI